MLKAKKHQDGSISKQTFTIMMNTPSRQGLLQTSISSSFETLLRKNWFSDVRPGFLETNTLHPVTVLASVM